MATLRTGVPIVSKKRRDPVALFAAARELADVVLGLDEWDAGPERLTLGLSALWPAPLTAALVRDRLEVADEAGHRQHGWERILRPLLAGWPDSTTSTRAAPVPPELNLPDHVLHEAIVGGPGRRYGALALALHKRTADASTAHALLMYLGQYLGLRLHHQEAERQAWGRQRDFADLTNLVGHEFNNALNSVGLQVAALAQKGVTADHFPELAEIRRVIPAAGLMVRRLQELCYAGAGLRQPSDLNRAVRVAAHDPALATQVRLELDPGVPLVQGAPQDLERLAGAVLRATAAPASAAVSARTGQGPGPVVWLRVEDAGPDPDDGQLRALFEPFAAVREGGDGLAAPLAKAIVRRLGGSIRAERRVGGGLVLVAELRPAREQSA
jgi:signal transduction histidine kinase